MNDTTPILILIFNRPDSTQRLIDCLALSKPSKIYIAADGPRKDKSDDNIVCNKTRELAISSISWECEVKTLFREENLGCAKAVSSSISWFFNHVEYGIILEDDCLPSPYFFSFMEKTLINNINNRKIMCVSGDGYPYFKQNQKQILFESKFAFIWGWGTWKDRWEKYNLEINDSQGQIDSILSKTHKNRKIRAYWKKEIHEVKDKLHTWDFQFSYTMWKNNMYCLTPNRNMISNIGFDSNATHTINEFDSRNSKQWDEIHNSTWYYQEYDERQQDVLNSSIFRSIYNTQPNRINKLKHNAKMLLIKMKIIRK